MVLFFNWYGVFYLISGYFKIGNFKRFAGFNVGSALNIAL